MVVGQQLLQDMLPWLEHCSSSSVTSTTSKTTIKTKQPAPSTVLINDTLETNGRFLLYITARKEVAKCKTRILWLTCSASQNQRLIDQGLSKMVLDGATTGSTARRTNTEISSNNKPQITVRCIVQEIGQAIEKSSQDKKIFAPQQFMRDLYVTVRTWCDEDQESPAYIFLEDVSALANLVGSRLSYAFVYQLQVLKQKINIRYQKEGKSGMLCLVITSAGDGPLGQTTTNNNNAFPSWVGAGGRFVSESATSTSLVVGEGWECGLVELADWIVDVVPLATGFSRNVHGRLIVTPKSVLSDAFVINYCLGENQVWGTRMHTSMRAVT
ncbi:hypothetical protein ACA910_000219 [Epithemia clementina (nom. ined.)]